MAYGKNTSSCHPLKWMKVNALGGELRGMLVIRTGDIKVTRVVVITCLLRTEATIQA